MVSEHDVLDLAWRVATLDVLPRAGCEEWMPIDVALARHGGVSQAIHAFRSPGARRRA